MSIVWGLIKAAFEGGALILAARLVNVPNPLLALVGTAGRAYRTIGEFGQAIKRQPFGRRERTPR